MTNEEVCCCENESDVQSFITDKATSKDLEIDPDAYKLPYKQLLTNYNDHYRKRNEQNRILKTWFFILTFGLVIGICILLAVLCIILAKRGLETAGQIGVVITAVGSILSSIIILPTIIAKYLFPPKEDSEILDVVKAMRKEDKEEYLFKDQK